MGKQNRSHKVSSGNKPKGDQDTVQEEIRKLAYQLFCECGCEQGHDLEHWLEAERRMVRTLKDES